jgi:glycosyltransferase involved in cell wall biosynthesis
MKDKHSTSLAHPSIAIIICTRNNPQKLQLTLATLSHLLPKEIRLILVDQSKEKNDFPSNLSITYIHTPNQKGLSTARNTALRHATEDVLAWLDDDCIISKKYITELRKIAKIAPTAKKKRIAGICGRTLPYLPTQQSLEQICPCIFSKTDSRPVKKIQTHWKYIGFGNNMVFFRYIFDELGGFKEWLGNGSIGESAEDGEFMIRCLAAGYQFLYENDLLMYHNKWLSPTQLRKQNWIYSCGNTTLYGFYTFQGIQECLLDLKQGASNTLQQVIESARQIKRKPSRSLEHLNAIFFESGYFLKGLFLGVLFAKVLPIPEKENILRFYKKH